MRLNRLTSQLRLRRNPHRGPGKVSHEQTLAKVVRTSKIPIRSSSSVQVILLPYTLAPSYNLVRQQASESRLANHPSSSSLCCASWSPSCRLRELRRQPWGSQLLSPSQIVVFSSLSPQEPKSRYVDSPNHSMSAAAVQGEGGAGSPVGQHIALHRGVRADWALGLDRTRAGL